jgi:hypothetical protein
MDELIARLVADVVLIAPLRKKLSASFSTFWSRKALPTKCSRS